MQVYQDLWREMKSGKWINVTTVDDGIKTVIKQPNLVFIASKESLEAMASQICTVTTLDDSLLPVWNSLGVRKNSDYLGYFNDT